MLEFVRVSGVSPEKVIGWGLSIALSIMSCQRRYHFGAWAVWDGASRGASRRKMLRFVDVSVLLNGWNSR